MREPEKTIDIEFDLDRGGVLVGVDGGERAHPLAHLSEYLSLGWDALRSLCLGGIVERTVEVVANATYEACTGKEMTKWQKIGTRIGASGVGAMAAKASLGLLVRKSPVQVNVDVAYPDLDQGTLFDYEEVEDGGEGRAEA